MKITNLKRKNNHSLVALNDQQLELAQSEADPSWCLSDRQHRKPLRTNSTRSTAMTDIYEHEVNTINHQTSGELSEQVLQTVNGGLLDSLLKRGGTNPHTVDGETFFDAVGPSSHRGLRKAYLAEGMAVATGTAASLGVGAVTELLSKKSNN